MKTKTKVKPEVADAIPAWKVQSTKLKAIFGSTETNKTKTVRLRKGADLFELGIEFSVVTWKTGSKQQEQHCGNMSAAFDLAYKLIVEHETAGFIFDEPDAKKPKKSKLPAHAGKLEDTYQVTLPAFFAGFLSGPRPAALRGARIDCLPFLNGVYAVDFTSSALLDLQELGELEGIGDLEAGGDLDGNWHEHFPTQVPLATLQAVRDDEDDFQPKAFLVIDVGGSISLFHEEGWKLWPVATSLKELVAKLSTPPATTAKPKRGR